MRRFIGPLTRIVILALTLMIQIGFIQLLSFGQHPWINLPLIFLLWSAVQRLDPWPLIAAGGVGLLIDLSSNQSFGIFILAHVLATLTVMVISVEWLSRRGTGNRVLIGVLGLLVYGVTIWIAQKTQPEQVSVMNIDVLIEVLLLWTAFTLLKICRPIWVSITKPVKRYA